MRGELKNVKKRIDDEDRNRKAAVMGDVVEAAKEHILVNNFFSTCSVFSVYLNIGFIFLPT